MTSNYLSCIKFYLSHGSDNIEISEPAKFDQLKLSIERGNFHGFNPNVIRDGLNLGFDNTEVSNARDFIIDKYLNFGGNDAEVYFSFGSMEYGDYTEIFKGKINFNSMKDLFYRVEVSSERDEFEDLIRTRLEVPVNLFSNETIDGNESEPLTPIIQTLHSKQIRKSLLIDQSLSENLPIDFETYEDSDFDTNEGSYFLVDYGETRWFIQGSPNPVQESEYNSDTVRIQLKEFDNKTVEELDTFYIDWGFTREGYEKGEVLEEVSFMKYSERSLSTINLKAEDMEVILWGGSDRNIVSFLDCSNSTGKFNNFNYKLYYLSRDAELNTKNKIIVDSFNSSDLVGTCPNLLSLIVSRNIDFEITEQFEEGESFIFYFELFVDGRFRKKLSGYPVSLGYGINFNNKPELSIKSETQTEETKAALVSKFEAYEKIIRDITGYEDRFRSSVLGRTDSQPYQYNQDGKYSLQAFTNGYQIRQFPISERPIYMNLNNTIEFDAFVNGLGYGFESESSVKRLIVEDWRFFYKDEYIFNHAIDIHDYTVEIDRSILWNELEIGFEKWADEQINNLDEFASKSIYNSGLKSYKKKIKRVSKILASGYLIELLRRDSYAKFSTKDNDFDEANFVVSLLRDEISESGFITERDQNFNLIENVFSPSTVYNASLSRSSMVYRYLEYLASSVARKSLDHKIRHLFGEGNNDARFVNDEYDLSENQNFSLSYISPIFTPENDCFSSLLSYSQYLHILNNRTKLLSFLSDNGVIMSGWIKSLEYNVKNSIAKIKTIRKNES